MATPFFPLRPVRQVFNSTPATVGDGFVIRRPLPNTGLRQLSPFLMLDHAGPLAVAPTDTPKGVDEHPHRGFETVTVVYQGHVAHRDSVGNQGTVGPGGAQWMTAAAGLVHEEKHEKEFARRGGTLEIIQLWINLPRQHKMMPPRYQNLTAESIPEVALPHHQGVVRVIAGEYANVAGGAQTVTPVTLLDIRLAAGAELTLDLPLAPSLGIYLVKGKVEFGSGEGVIEAQLAVFDESSGSVTIKAQAESTLLVLGGQPINEPLATYGPFVMNTTQELMQAVEDYQSGKMGRLI